MAHDGPSESVQRRRANIRRKNRERRDDVVGDLQDQLDEVEAVLARRRSFRRQTPATRERIRELQAEARRLRSQISAVRSVPLSDTDLMDKDDFRRASRPAPTTTSTTTPEPDTASPASPSESWRRLARPARPPATASDAQVTPEIQAMADLLGVPADELARRMQTGGATNDPTVWTGSEYMPVSQALSSLYGMNDANLRTFQQRAVEVGLLDAVTGKYDSATAEAWMAAVNASAGFASQGRKISPFDALGYIASGADNADERPPLTAAVSNPLELRDRVEELMVAKLGSKRLPKKTVDAIVATYQELQRRSQQQEYDMAETGGTVTAPPSFDTFAENEVRKADPVAWDAHAALSGFDLIARMMRGSADVA